MGVLTSSIGVRVGRFFWFVAGGGAVGQGVLLGVVWMCVCVGSGLQILIRFGGGCRAGSRRKCRLMCVWVRGQGGVATCWHTTHSLLFQLPCHSRSASTPMKFLIMFVLIFYLFLFMFVFCLWIFVLVKTESYILNRFNKLRKWLIPFHAIWGLCW